MKLFKILAVCFLAMASMTACTERGDRMDQPGEAAEEGFEDLGEGIEDAGENVEDAAE